MRYLSIFFFIATGLAVNAQQKVEEQLYSTALKAPVRFTVYVPADRDTLQTLPALYSFGYGMVSGDYIAAQLNYFQSANYPFPPTIVVNILANMDRIGFVYDDGRLTPTGKEWWIAFGMRLFPL
ncbi:hypothetical protein [Paraflavitalea pollutisoli]|uniref:hypothetical protein n=1 Tax=Paraflavitalea pollutisoli TaxID=3034143 RepID=UPI0023EC44B2|nr:hypothetical protein [Paraflavitalea sp. H1-2-19X]